MKYSVFNFDFVVCGVELNTYKKKIIRSKNKNITLKMAFNRTMMIIME